MGGGAAKGLFFFFFVSVNHMVEHANHGVCDITH